MEWLWIPLAVLGYFICGAAFWRVSCYFGNDSPEDDVEVVIVLSMMWPLLAGVTLLCGTAWLLWQAAWKITDAPAAVARRIAEQKQLRKADRIRRLREAEAILADEGLDFSP